MSNDKIPKRISNDIGKEITPADHTIWDHKENMAHPNSTLRHTPEGEVRDTALAEQKFRQMNPPEIGESISAYETRISNLWAESQGNLASLTMQDFFIKDFTEHRLESSDNFGRPGSADSNDPDNIGFFGGSSTVATQDSRDGTQPMIPGQPAKKNISVPGYKELNPVDQKSRQINDAVGLSAIEDSASRNGDFKVVDDAYSANIKVPISPLYPFTRMEPRTASEVLFNAYNRNKIPIADIEHRKAFRHVFFGRPECYIFGLGGQISQQCLSDPDFSSMLSRMPHILALLSPVYCTQTVGFGLGTIGPHLPEDINTGNPEFCNWNYILSNRVKGFSPTGYSISFDENMIKSMSENTIMPGGISKANAAGSLSLQFSDTKHFEIYEMLRMWMVYIHKRKRGILAPSFDGYNPINRFPEIVKSTDTEGSNIDPEVLLKGHPYDRALEYCAPLWDIITDETMTNILYWCKYYGVYPISANNTGLSSDNGLALTEQMTVEAEFRFQFKREGLNMNLLEFNHNAGIVNDVGQLRGEFEFLSSSSPFLVRKNDKTPMENYIGAAGMFTGSPYIVMEINSKQIPMPNNPLKGNGDIKQIITPQLRFLPLPSSRESQLNLGINNIMDTPRRAIERTIKT